MSWLFAKDLTDISAKKLFDGCVFRRARDDEDVDVAAPAGMIGASNFFELSVAVAITLFGAGSPVVLATVVGVLVEVLVMLALVKFANRTRHWFPERV